MKPAEGAKSYKLSTRLVSKCMFKCFKSILTKNVNLNPKFVEFYCITVSSILNSLNNISFKSNYVYFSNLIFSFLRIPTTEKWKYPTIGKLLNCIQLLIIEKAYLDLPFIFAIFSFPATFSCPQSFIFSLA